MPYPNQQALLSEEDIRTRVVATWLADHGFTAENISVEFSFELRLGRNVYRVGEELPHSPTFRPRADVLVRSSDGRNLLIIEVKAPNETLDENAKAQGISYARLLKSGGLAPFVVITNGHETQIYDSITEEEMQDAYIPINHRHAQNRFRVSIDDIALRAEALETFVSLSSDNLLAFCRAQVAQRMRVLRSDDPSSGKKYIPALYIEREDARKQLHRLVNEERRQVVLLAGAPQVGKTNFVCHSVEERLESGQPCLFYPAIGMERGLLEEISEDFNWIFNESSAPHRIISKLTRILQKTNQRLLIFIDGWNEASQGLARAIDRGSERLNCNEIQIIISFTNVAAKRLLLDEVGNPSHIAEAASIEIDAASLIEVKPEKISRKQSRIFLDRYSPEEIESAYQKYAHIFNVEISDGHQKINDPLLLRIGMEQFRNGELPTRLDEPELLERSLLSKALRVIDTEEDCVKVFLEIIADEIFKKDAPINQLDILRRCGLPITAQLPKGLFEAALLAKVSSINNSTAVDFYYSREKDFAIAIWARDWLSKFRCSQSMWITELELSIQSQAGNDALQWFLSQLIYQGCLRLAIECFPSYRNPQIKVALLTSLWTSVKYRTSSNEAVEIDEDWIINAMYTALDDSDKAVKVQGAKLMAILIEDDDELVSALTEDSELIEGLLSVEEDFPLGHESIGAIILDALRTLHARDLGVCIDSDSEVTRLLKTLLEHQNLFIRKAASKIFGYLAPKVFLSELFNRITLDKLRRKAEEPEMKFIEDAYAEGVRFAVEEMEKIYYGYDDGGGFCPPDIGNLARMIEDDVWGTEEIILENLCNEYITMYELCSPVVEFYFPNECSQNLLSLLENLLNFVTDYQHKSGLHSIRKLSLPSISNIRARRCQLWLPFLDG